MPPGSHIFQHIKFILAIMVEGHPRTICTKLFSIKAQQFLTRRFLKFFCLVAMATRILYGMENFLENLKGDYPRIILVKFGEILPCGLGDVI